MQAIPVRKDFGELTDVKMKEGPVALEAFLECLSFVDTCAGCSFPVRVLFHLDIVFFSWVLFFLSSIFGAVGYWQDTRHCAASRVVGKEDRSSHVS